MYHPTPPTDAEREAGFTSSSLFEYLVLTNVGNQAIDLKGIRFTNGISFDFDSVADPTLTANGTAILVRNQSAFQTRYGTEHPVIGEYEGKLDDAGERLTLTDAAGKDLMSLRYNDKEPWPVEADGEGSSLQLTSSDAGIDFGDSANWKAGDALAGDGTPPPPSEGLDAWSAEYGIEDLFANGDGDQLADVIEYVLATDPLSPDTPEAPPTISTDEVEVGGETDTYYLLSYAGRANVDGVNLELETSTDLVSWSSFALVPQSSTPIDATRATIVMRSQDPVNGTAPQLFGRLKVTTTP